LNVVLKKLLAKSSASQRGLSVLKAYQTMNIGMIRTPLERYTYVCQTTQKQRPQSHPSQVNRSIY